MLETIIIIASLLLLIGGITGGLETTIEDFNQ